MDMFLGPGLTRAQNTKLEYNTYVFFRSGRGWPNALTATVGSTSISSTESKDKPLT